MKKSLVIPTLCLAVLSTPAFEKVVHAASSEVSKSSITSTVKTTTKYVNVSSSSSLMLRSKASTSGKVLDHLKRGTAVTVYSTSNGWSKIKVNGKTGYVSSKYLSTAKISTSTVEKSSTTATVKTTTKYVNVSSNSSLTLRSQASTKGKMLASLKRGTSVTVYSTSKGWSKVKANGKTGYVHSQYLSTTKPVVTTTKYATTSISIRSTASTKGSVVTKASKGASVTVYSTTNGWSKVTVSGKTGYVESKYLSTTKPVVTTKYVDVDESSSLILRSTASETGTILTSLKRGTSVTVYSTTGDWAKVEANGKTGYVHSKYLSLTKPSTSSNTPSTSSTTNNNNTSSSSNTNTASTSNSNSSSNVTENDHSDSNSTTTSESIIKYVNVSNGSSLNMRSTPSSSASIVTKLARGTAVTFYSEANGWSLVSANGKTGYVNSAYLSSTVVQLPGAATAKISKVYEAYNITLNDAVNIQMKVNPQTDKKYSTFISSSAFSSLNSSTNPTQGVVSGTWNIRGGAGTNYWVVATAKNGTTLKILSKVKAADGSTWYQVSLDQSWVNASPDDVKYYLDPNNFSSDAIQQLQFLKLSTSANLDPAEVNEKILAGKGILAGKAAAFIKAGQTYGINEIYLIAHALLETGKGTSDLANGVSYKGVTVYNMYGIGAYDNDPTTGGAAYAYSQGWTTPEKAIIGGAAFIAKDFINAGQDTLYKMKWNPNAAAASNTATHQYATDIGWASKQVQQIYNLYSLLTSYSLTLDIPTYKE